MLIPIELPASASRIQRFGNIQAAGGLCGGSYGIHHSRQIHQPPQRADSNLSRSDQEFPDDQNNDMAGSSLCHRSGSTEFDRCRSPARAAGSRGDVSADGPGQRWPVVERRTGRTSGVSSRSYQKRRQRRERLVDERRNQSQPSKGAGSIRSGGRNRKNSNRQTACR